MKIDTDLLRTTILGSCRAACMGVEFKRVYYDAYEVENASDEELLQIAERMGINPMNYQKDEEVIR